MGESYKLLVVDDEVNFLKSIQLYLQLEGYEVDTADAPHKALELVRDNKYSVIISDVLMPEMDGFELRAELRKTENASKTPIILLTAKEITMENLKELDDNLTGFVMKPFDHQILVEVIQDLIKRAIA